MEQLTEQEQHILDAVRLGLTFGHEFGWEPTRTIQDMSRITQTTMTLFHIQWTKELGNFFYDCVFAGLTNEYGQQYTEQQLIALMREVFEAEQDDAATNIQGGNP